MRQLSYGDYLVFFIYFVIVATYGLTVYRRKKKSDVSKSKDYFLAEGSLTWWAIGASLIASNISAEQMVAMSSNGFTMGLAISTYEWMAALTLIIVAVFFIPVYLKNKIFTMPQFLHQRYNSTVAMIMAVFWLLLYVIVNLTSILYLGAIAIHGISGVNFNVCIGLLAVFAIVITLGGMKVIGYTDVIQVFFLILGGLVTTYIAVNLVATHYGQSGIGSGLSIMYSKFHDHFHMILKKDNASYGDLPGLTVLIGGMWIVNLNYWGCNQYITQRALGADLPTARGGILFAAFLKLLMPLIVVLPGIAAFVLYKENVFNTDMAGSISSNHDNAYPVLLNLLPAGIKGLAFAALTAAVVASLAGKANSIATIFTLDIYKKKIRPDASETNLVKVGKITVVVAMILGVVISPFLGIDKKGGFQFIQEYTGFVSPGIFAMFILGFFWKKASSNAAMFATIGGFIFSVFFKFLPKLTDLSSLAHSGFSYKNADSHLYEIPFLDRMGFVFVICIVGMIVISLIDHARGKTTNGLEVDAKMFRTTNGFAVGALIIIGILVALYTVFW
ncbi:sodium:solute symporter family transporter [Mucilaginibacter gotjawali]|uniref:Sodium/glucose cotransporter n=2 Tax=Mucilaginibacter gotjawali TaxID=1550579 RepID=A0A0X8X4Y1_9SPHI|nr:sodium/solute symporter [Mucilaginibacter gotjawali]MBB3058472.1 SSS family solute:Na+ symporter [Mucilaginibacter gotjawali]BAU55696.1 Sodium/glucose cotransporter [Mucilaginibacter gotjawali]